MPHDGAMCDLLWSDPGEPDHLLALAASKHELGVTATDVWRQLAVVFCLMPPADAFLSSLLPNLPPACVTIRNQQIPPMPPSVSHPCMTLIVLTQYTLALMV